MAFSIYLVGKVTKLYYVGDLFTALIAALILALVNAVLRPILVFFSIIPTILTLGLFLFLVNGLCLIIASKLVPKFKVEGCFTAAIASILISIVNMILEHFLV
jgi:putative membrane protein